MFISQVASARPCTSVTLASRSGVVHEEDVRVAFYQSLWSLNLNVQGMDMAHTFAFDHVYDAKTTQEEVYTNTAQPAVMSVLKVAP